MDEARAGVGIGLGRSFTEVMHKRTGGSDGLGMRGQAEAFEAGHAELFGEQALTITWAEDPFFETRFDALRRGIKRAFRTAGTGRREQAGLTRQEDFAR